MWNAGGKLTVFRAVSDFLMGKVSAGLYLLPYRTVSPAFHIRRCAPPSPREKAGRCRASAIRYLPDKPQFAAMAAATGMAVGDPLEIRSIIVRLGQALAGGAHPRRISSFESPAAKRGCLTKKVRQPQKSKPGYVQKVLYNSRVLA